MKKEKLLIPVVALSFFLSIPVSADELQDSFLKDMSEGLAERWAYDDDENTMTKSEFVEFRKKVVSAETSRLGKYEDQTFENEKFDLMAHAYIEAINNQLDALKYYEELENIYDLEWSAGYNMRAALIPVFVDSYGLSADETIVKDFRENNPYEITISTSTPETNAISTSEDEFLIYNNEGISIYVTGFSKDEISKNIYFRIENLNHHDIVVGSSNYKVIVNGSMVDSSLWEEVKSGKTATATLSFYTTQDDLAGIETITDVTLTPIIIDAGTYNTLYTGQEVYLSVDEENSKVSSRVVYNDKETIRQVQELLNAAGYNCGAADGIPGKQTNSAILKFEEDHNLPSVTDITPELLNTLKESIG